MAQKASGSLTITNITDGANANIWTTSTAPTTPNYTFTISNLTGADDNPRVGDIILQGVYRYTITSIGSTTVLAGSRQSLQGATGAAGGKWYSGTGITGTNTTAQVFSDSGVSSAVVGDMYLNTSTDNVYQCTTAGNASTAKWKYVGNIKGSTGNQGRSVTSVVTEYYRKLSGGSAPTSSTTGSTTIPDYVDGCTYYTRTITNFDSGNPDKSEWVANSGLTNEIKNAYDAWIAAGAAELKVAKIIQNSEGMIVTSGINGGDVTPGTASTYGYNTLMAPNYLGLRYNAINLAKLTTTESTPALEFYIPSVNSGGTPVQGNKGLSISATALTFYNPSNNAAQLIIGSNGTLQSGNYTRGSDSKFSSNGTKIDLINGDIITKYFRVSQGLESGLNAGVYVHGTIEALDGTIGTDTTNYWEIGNGTDYNLNDTAKMIGHGSSYIQLGDLSTWRLATNRIHTGWYISSDSVLHYPTIDNKYWDFGIHVPNSDSPAGRGSDKFIYIRTQNAANNSLQNLLYDIDDNYSSAQWEYKFYIDKSGNLTTTGSIDAHSISIDGQSIAGGSLVAGSLASYGGTSNRPVYFPSSGDNQGKPVQITVTDNSSATAVTSTDTNLITARTLYYAGYTKNTGTVTSVRVQATSPVQSSTSTAQTATLNTTISLADGYGDTKNPYSSKTKNYVLAAPSGAAGVPSFRLLVASDIPDLSAIYLPLAGGTVTGPVEFGDSVTVDDISTGGLVVSGSATFSNNIAANTINGVTVGSTPKFTDTTYTFANGTNGFTVTPLGGSAQTVTVTPSISNNVTGSGTNGYLVKWSGTNTVTNGPAIGSGTTKFLREDGTWVVPAGTGVTSVAASGSGGITISGSPITTSGTIAIGLNLSTAINGLSEGSSDATRNDYIVAQYAGGGTTTTTYHRRKLSNIFAALNASDITTALGFTPYDSANPNGYTSNTGTVTSVRVQATSPVVSSTSTASSTTLNTTISLANAYGDTKNPYGTKTANYVLAGPSSGDAAAPTFRALVAADIPELAWSKITSGKPTTLSGYGITDAKIENGVITLGSNTITPLTSASTLNAAKLSGAIPSAVTATTQTAGDNSTKIATTAFVTTAITNLPEPMIFKGSLGTGGTITSLPTASSTNEGFTYKVITAGTYASQSAKIGDTFISDGSNWVLIPSGDEPSGTVTSITLKAGSGISLDTDNTAITTSGTRTISHADTSNQASVTAASRTYITAVTLDEYGHVTGLSTGTESVTNTDTKLQVAAVTSGTTYYPIVGTGTSAATRQYDTTGFIYVGTNGTTSAVGSAKLTLGNSTASGTANNKQGQLILYGSTAYAHTISGAPTAARSLTLPDKAGTIALTSDIPSSLKNPNALTLNLFNETAERASANQGTATSTVSYDGSTANQSFSAAGVNAITSISASAASGGSTTFTLIRANGAKSTFDVTVTASVATGATKLTDGSGNAINSTGSTTPVYFSGGLPVDVTGIAYSLLPTGTSTNTVATGDHTHGNITNGGDITATAPTIASGDQLVINDHSASKITNGPTFDGSTTTAFLTKAGTWATYSLPLAANGTRGGVQIGYTTSGKNYAVQLSSEKMYVNVPWTDTTYSAGTGLSLSGTTFNHSNSITAGTAGTSSATSSTNRTIAVPYVTYDAQGHITGSGTHTHTFDSFPEAYLSWGGKNFSGSYGPIDAAMIDVLGANRFAFLKAAGLTIEYSTDAGSTWTDYGATDVQKTGLFGAGQSFTLGKHTANGSSTINDRLRVTINTGTAGLYTVLNKIAIYMSTAGNTVQVLLEKALQSTPTTYSTHLDWTGITGWSGWNILNISGLTTYGNTAASQYGRVRFTFRQTAVNSGSYPAANISRIMGFGGVGWNVPSNMARDGHLYSYDNSQNATFPAQVTATQFNGPATKLTTSTGSATVPVYFSNGVPTNASTYAGGTKVTLNDSDKGASTASFYAPTTAGTENYILASNGSGAPKWIAQSTITSGNTDSYHTGDGWTGLTYKLGKVGNASDISITIPTGTTSTTVLRGDHTYATSIATSTGTNQITLAYGTKYALTAGGTSYVFTMPASDNTNTWRAIQVDGTQILGTGTSTGALNLKAGSNVSITNSSGTVTIAATDTNTHNTAYLYAGASNGTANAATTNGNTYLILMDGGSATTRRKISGTQNVSVASDSSGNITITGPDLSGYATTSAIPSNIVNTITTTAGAHTAITSQKGDVSFNVPTTAAHVGIKFGYTTSGNNRAVLQDSNGNLYVTQKDDNTNYYHTTGSWSGTNNLTYTATANGGAGALAFTLATASTSTYGVTKLSSTASSTEQGLAATPKLVYDSINGASSTYVTLNTNQTLTAAGTKTYLGAQTYGSSGLILGVTSGSSVTGKANMKYDSALDALVFSFA